MLASVTPSANPPRPRSILSSSRDAVSTHAAPGKHDLHTVGLERPTKEEDSASWQPSAVYRKEHRVGAEPDRHSGAAASESMLSPTTATSSVDKPSTSDEAVSWAPSSPPGDDGHVSRLSMSAAQSRIPVGLRFATWSAHGLKSPLLGPAAGASAMTRQTSDSQQQTPAPSSFAAHQFSGSPPTSPTPLTDTPGEIGANALRYFSPLVEDSGVDSREETINNTTELERPSSRRTAFARRMNQLADARISVYSLADTQNHQPVMATSGSCGTPQQEPAGSVSHASDGTSLGVVVLSATPPSDMPDEPHVARATLPIDDTRYPPIQLPESAVHMGGSFMSLSTRTDFSHVTTAARPSSDWTERGSPRRSVMSLRSANRQGMSKPPALRPSTSSRHIATEVSAGTSTASGDVTPDSYGPPNTERRDTMPLMEQQAILVEVHPPSTRSEPGADANARDEPSRLPPSDTPASVPAADHSEWLMQARAQRSLAHADSLKRPTLRSLEEEELDLVRRSGAARMAQAEEQSAVDVAAMLPRLPCKVTVRDPIQPTTRSAQASRAPPQLSRPDKLRQLVHLQGAQRRVEVEMARLSRVQKELDARHGTVRYFPAV